MSVELNWHEGEESGDVLWGQPETPAAAEPTRTIVSHARERPRPGRSRTIVPFLLAVLAGVLIGAAALGVFLAVRANENSELARQDVEGAVALLLETQRTGDVRGYAQLLDPTAEVWRSRQIAELRQAAPPPAQVNVQSVRLQGDLALAELLEMESGSGEATTRTAFFRLRDGQWLLTAPDPEQFGPTAQGATSHFVIDYRGADDPLMPALVDLAEGSYVALCGELRCRASERPISLVLSYGDTNALVGEGLTVTSPQLVGIDSAGHPGSAFQREFLRALAIHLAADRFPAASPTLRGVVGEWAVADLMGTTSAEMKTLRLAARQGTWIPLDGAWQAVVENRGNPLERALVASIFGYVQETGGGGAVGRLLEGSTGDLPDALQSAFGITMADFQTGWQAWILAGPADADLPA